MTSLGLASRLNRWPSSSWTWTVLRATESGWWVTLST